MTGKLRSPQAFRLESETKAQSKSQPPAIVFEPEPEPASLVVAPMAEASAHRRRSPWGMILLSAVVALLLMWFGLTVTNLVQRYFTSSPFLGWLALALTGIAALSLLVMIAREIGGLMRLRRIEHLQATTSRAINLSDQNAMQLALKELEQLYASRADMAWPLKNWTQHKHDIMNPVDALRLAERLLLEPLDEAAHRIIAKRAKRVTLLTTVTPAAAFDMLLVATQNILMIREVAELYGGRPSLVATLRLSRLVLTHLAVAGGLALSENFLHVFVGKGVIGKLSARFGEGAVNGVLTSRIGLAAIEVCRPIAKESSRRETLTSLIKEMMPQLGSSDATR